jgi:hypothetical protein
LNFQNLYEVYVLMSQAARQLEVPTSGYGWTPMVAHAEILDSKQCWSETSITPSFGLRLRRMSVRWKGNFINFSI